MYVYSFRIYESEILGYIENVWLVWSKDIVDFIKLKEVEYVKYGYIFKREFNVFDVL